MKWKDFKKKLDEAGVQDEDEIWYIDITFDDEVFIEKDSSLGWKIAS